MKEIDLAQKNLILKTVTGSHLYGTEREDSDLDYTGIAIFPKEYVYGLHRCDQVILNDKHKDERIDYTCYSILKYIHLAIANNPNIISVLYTPKERIVHIDEYGAELMEQRAAFLSKKAYHTFRGYAHAQRRKIMFKENVVGKRKELIDAHGFDTKFAMHLIRLLYECLDIMVNKEIVYPSPHNKMLMEIRAGEKDLPWVLAEATRLENLIDEAYVKSDLQYKADVDRIEKFQMNLLEKFWRER